MRVVDALTKIETSSWPERILLTFAIIVFVFPFLIAATNYPQYYEDESWVYSFVFEFLRGNGVSGSALGIEQTLPLFALISALPIALSPLGPEASVRLVSLFYSLFALSGVYILARRLAPRGAIYAVALFIAVPMLFLTLRFGRREALVIGLALYSLFAASTRRPMLAGALSGVAVLVHPVTIWLGPVALAWLWQSERRVRPLALYVAPVLLLAAAQGVWLMLHWDSVVTSVDRFLVSASISNDGVFSSLLHEVDRYTAYWRALMWQDRVAQLLLLFVPLGIALALIRKRDLWPIGLAFISAVVALAVLVGAKNHYYLVHALPLAIILAAVPVSHAPRIAVLTMSTLLIGWTAYRHIPAAIDASKSISASIASKELAVLLPKGAVVVGPMLYGGLILARPDLRYYSYHALSDADGWRLPSCAHLNQRVITLAANDPRRTTQKYDSPQEVYYVSHPYGSLAYLRQIYAAASEEIAACFLAGETLDVPSEQTCARVASGNCRRTVVRRQKLY